MSAAHPWLETDPWPDKKLPKDQLTDRIERTLTLTNLAVLGTTGEIGAIASPLEFYADGVVCYIFPQPGSPKIRAMQRDPRICLAVCNPMAGWVVARGAQLFADAQLLDPGTPDWEHGMKIFRWQGSSAELGRASTAPPNGQLLKVDPHRIVYTEHYLRKTGYAPRQIWRRDED